MLLQYSPGQFIQRWTKGLRLSSVRVDYPNPPLSTFVRHDVTSRFQACQSQASANDETATSFSAHVIPPGTLASRTLGGCESGFLALRCRKFQSLWCGVKSRQSHPKV